MVTCTNVPKLNLPDRGVDAPHIETADAETTERTIHRATKEPMCPSGYHIEQHKEESHGNVCRAENSAAFVCPRCCHTLKGPPYCVRTNVTGGVQSAGPCRLETLASCSTPMPPVLKADVSENHLPHHRYPKWGGAAKYTKTYWGAWKALQARNDKLAIVTLTGDCQFVIYEPLKGGPTPRTVANNRSLSLSQDHGSEWVNQDPPHQALGKSAATSNAPKPIEQALDKRHIYIYIYYTSLSQYIYIQRY